MSHIFQHMTGITRAARSGRGDLTNSLWRVRVCHIAYQVPRAVPKCHCLEMGCSEQALATIVSVVAATACFSAGAGPQHRSRGGSFGRRKVARPESLSNRGLARIVPDATIVPFDTWDIICDVVFRGLPRDDMRVVAALTKMCYADTLSHVVHTANSRTGGQWTPQPILHFLHRRPVPDKQDQGEVVACDLNRHYEQVKARSGDLDEISLRDILIDFDDEWPLSGVPRIVTFSFRRRNRLIVVFSIAGTDTMDHGDHMADASATDMLRGMMRAVPRGMTLLPRGDSFGVGTESTGPWARQNASMAYHSGFCSYGGNAFDMIKSHLETAYASAPPAEVWIYGHSLGGSSAMLCACALKHAYDHRLGTGPQLELSVDGEEYAPDDDDLENTFSVDDLTARGDTDDEGDEDDENEVRSGGGFFEDMGRAFETAQRGYQSVQHVLQKPSSSAAPVPHMTLESAEPGVVKQLGSRDAEDEFEANMHFLVDGMQGESTLPLSHSEPPAIHCTTFAAPSYVQGPGPLSLVSGDASPSFSITNFTNRGDAVLYNVATTALGLRYPVSCSSSSGPTSHYGVVRFGVLDANDDTKYPCNRGGPGGDSIFALAKSPLTLFTHGHFMDQDGLICVEKRKLGHAESLLRSVGIRVSRLSRPRLNRSSPLHANTARQ